MFRQHHHSLHKRIEVKS
uniref:Uncharacterized protein n=1 Tax=Rhizophora mucronata TaxID=61149 RepID=A0A2P2QS25_RHIMU